jgi:hypothetical protein
MAAFEYDVVIAGASFGGVAAALAAAGDPKVKVVLLESSQWVGGQATSQGVTRWDEAAANLTETTGSPKSYRDLRHLIRAEYTGKRSAVGLQQQYFNPGFAEVGPPFAAEGHPFAVDPQVARTVLTNLLQNAGVAVKFGVTVTAIDVQNGAIQNITAGGDTYTGKVYVDATDLGDLLPLCGVKWVIGCEARSDTGESQAEGAAHPEWIQPFTVPIALEWRPPGEDHRIAKPPNYDDIRQRQGFDRLKAPGPDGGEGDIHVVYNLTQQSDTLFNYRQFIDPRNFNDGRVGRTAINVGSNDYLTRAIPTNPHSAAADAQIVEEARAVSVAYAYYLQNDVPRDDGNGTGYPNLMIDTAAFGTADGTAPVAYIRESRRLANPRVRVVQQDIDAAVFDGPRAKNFPDSCGIGWYAADVHEGWYSTDGNPANAATPNIGTPWHGIKTAPFQVPLGSLLPTELSNFVAACKNIGATHLTSGAYRVHPVEWAIGEAAGVFAAYCTTQNIAPGDAWSDAGRVTAYQSRLLARGTPIFWWDDVIFEDGVQAYTAIQLLGARGTFEGDGTTRNFEPNGDFPQATREAMNEKLNHTFNWPAGSMTRAQGAELICQQLGIP